MPVVTPSLKDRGPAVSPLGSDNLPRSGSPFFFRQHLPSQLETALSTTEQRLTGQVRKEEVRKEEGRKEEVRKEEGRENLLLSDDVSSFPSFRNWLFLFDPSP